jgi:hypothetical protein
MRYGKSRGFSPDTREMPSLRRLYTTFLGTGIFGAKFGNNFIFGKFFT